MLGLDTYGLEVFTPDGHKLIYTADLYMHNSLHSRLWYLDRNGPCNNPKAGEFVSRREGGPQSQDLPKPPTLARKRL